MRIPDEVIENYKDEPNRGQQAKNQMRRGAGSGPRGGRGGQSNRGGRQPNNLSSNVGGSNNSIGGARPAKQQRR